MNLIICRNITLLDVNLYYDFYTVKECGVASSGLTDNKTMVSWKFYVENVIIIFKKAGFDFSHRSQMNIIIVCNRMDKTYDFYMKHQRHAVEWKLNQLINSD